MVEKTELLRRIPRVKLWLVLVVTLGYCVVLLAAAHTTHSLTLRVEAYHALYNLLSLTGCLLTMKLSARPQSLHNTFGWARLEVLSMLTTLLFLTALCFSVAIESVQTAVHAGHQDAMHHPLSVMVLGGVGLFLNAVVFALIGGYTQHQGCFLEMRGSGGVWVGKQVTQEAVQAGRRTLSARNLKAGNARPHKTRQGIRDVFRDICGVLMVLACAGVVYWDDGGTVALYIDPALAVSVAAILMWLSYPFGKECCHILLQTIPGHIDVEEFQARLLQEFPTILNVHHLHIWTFTPEKVVATVHVVFARPRVYLSMKEALTAFFHEEGITQVTLQPEYLQGGATGVGQVCLLQCQNEHCHEKECCQHCVQPLVQVTTDKASGTNVRPRGGRGNASISEEGGMACCVAFKIPNPHHHGHHHHDQQQDHKNDLQKNVLKPPSEQPPSHDPGTEGPSPAAGSSSMNVDPSGGPGKAGDLSKRYSECHDPSEVEPLNGGDSREVGERSVSEEVEE